MRNDQTTTFLGSKNHVLRKGSMIRTQNIMLTDALNSTGVKGVFKALYHSKRVLKRKLEL